MSLMSPKMYFTISNFMSPSEDGDGRLVYVSINGDHAKNMFTTMINSCPYAGLKYIKLEQVDTNDEGIVIRMTTLRADWVRRSRWDHA